MAAVVTSNAHNLCNAPLQGCVECTVASPHQTPLRRLYDGVSNNPVVSDHSLTRRFEAGFDGVSYKRVCHNGSSGSSLAGFGLGHVLQYAPIDLTHKILPSKPF